MQLRWYDIQLQQPVHFVLANHSSCLCVLDPGWIGMHSEILAEFHLKKYTAMCTTYLLQYSYGGFIRISSYVILSRLILYYVMLCCVILSRLILSYLLSSLFLGCLVIFLVFVLFVLFCFLSPALFAPPCPCVATHDNMATTI